MRAPPSCYIHRDSAQPSRSQSRPATLSLRRRFTRRGQRRRRTCTSRSRSPTSRRQDAVLTWRAAGLQVRELRNTYVEGKLKYVKILNSYFAIRHQTRMCTQPRMCPRQPPTLPAAHASRPRARCPIRRLVDLLDLANLKKVFSLQLHSDTFCLRQCCLSWSRVRLGCHRAGR